MFVIRRAKPEDAGTLLKLAKMVHFINLPADREVIDQKIAWSRQCFLMAAENQSALAPESPSPKGKSKAKTTPSGKRTSAAANGHTVALADASAAISSAHSPALRSQASAQHPATGQISLGLRDLTGRSPLFVFTMEEIQDAADARPAAASSAHTRPPGGSVIGTCQIIASASSPGLPNLSLELKRVQKFSESLQMGVSHVTAQLHLDDTGPTEIGGLILQPSFRNHRAKLGRFLSLVRFHFIALHRGFFAPRLLAEMMGPVTADGQTPFWDGFTRPFINLSYEDADRFCQESKEFILALFPREVLYLTLIPPDARACVAQVGEETIPARRMLEKLGFTYTSRIDPFDGGPHLECATDEVALIRATRRLNLGAALDDAKAAALAARAIVSTIDDDGEFRAVDSVFMLDRAGRLQIPAVALGALGAAPGASCGFTPFETPAAPAGADGAVARPTTKAPHAAAPRAKNSRTKKTAR
ncbi:hypothetical protein BH11PLA1_BH11PLA1_14560 [soil metagenome]